MKSRTVAILAVILLGLVGVVFFSVHREGHDRPATRQGMYLLKDFPVNEVAALTIRGPTGSLSLAKDKERWVVKDRFNYPANFTKITALVRQIRELKILHQFPSDEEALRRQSLRDPASSEALVEEKGIRINVFDESGKPLADLLLGKVRKKASGEGPPDGQYVKKADDPEIYLVTEHFASVPTEPSGWLDAELLKVGAGEVKRIACMDPKDRKVRYAFHRPERGKDLQLEGPPPGAKIQRPLVTRLAGALSSLRIKDVKSPLTDLGPSGIDAAAILEYRLFDGTLYRIFPGKNCSEDPSCLLRVEVAYEASEEKGEETKVSGKDTKDLALEAKIQNERLSPWAYIVAKGSHEAFVTDLKGILEKAEAKPEEKKPEKKRQPKTTTNK